MSQIHAKDMLLGYSTGIFPMAEGKSSKELFWIKPKKRGIIPIGELHISKSLKKFIRSNNFTISINKCFSKVVDHCSDRPDTWINSELYKSYIELNRLGYAISIEVWSREILIGGLFGVRIGSCFCGESMFSLSTNGSKLAMVVTMAHLKHNKFTLFDTQFITDHLKSMGGYEISQIDYEEKLALAVKIQCEFNTFPTNYSWLEILQLNNHKL